MMKALDLQHATSPRYRCTIFGGVAVIAAVWNLCVAGPAISEARIYHVWYALELRSGARITSMRTPSPLTENECRAEIAKRERTLPHHTLRGEWVEISDGKPGKVRDRYCAARDGTRHLVVPATKPALVAESPRSVGLVGPVYVVWYSYTLDGRRDLIQHLDEPSTTTQVECERWRVMHAHQKIRSTTTVQMSPGDGVWREYTASLRKTWCELANAGNSLDYWPRADTLIPWVVMRTDSGEEWKLPWFGPTREHQSREECMRQHEQDEKVRPLLNRSTTSMGYKGTVIARVCEPAGPTMPHRMK